jgi:glucose/arabinose dehydrogenase
VLALLASAAALSAGGSAAIHVEPVARLDQPAALAAPPADRKRMFVAERSGRIRVIRDGRLVPRPFLDLRSSVEIRSRDIRFDQGGFLSLAFAPDYARSRRFYVLYTDRSDRVRLDEFRRSASNSDRAERSTRRLVLAIPRVAPVDVAGHLAFGPDKRLYASFGQGADEDASQDPGLLNGKLVRLDPRAAKPTPEIWASGFRVPWSFSFDRGNLAVADVGDARFEEIDYAPRGTAPGGNYGWPFVEGNHRRRAGGDALIAPVLTRAHGPRVCAIVGGMVVRDGRLPRLAGRYLYGDFCTGELRSARLRLPRATGDRREPATVSGLDALAADGRGRVWAASVLGGVFRLDPRR